MIPIVWPDHWEQVEGGEQEGPLEEFVTQGRQREGCDVWVIIDLETCECSTPGAEHPALGSRSFCPRPYSGRRKHCAEYMKG